MPYHIEKKKRETSMSKDISTFARIVKYDKNDDGTLTVYGKATDDSVDIDQQICDAAWLDRAMPDWFKTGGNIREQHSSIAAGVATEYEAKADGHYISALVVDPVSVKKVENRVLKGFSIGIRAPRVVRDNKAANGRIIDGQIVEISLVDRPANPNAKLLLAKSVEGEKSLVKVEEMNMKTIKELVAEASKFAPAELKKFDQTAYDNARAALAQLIIAEAKEMEEGEDETTSFAILFGAVSALLTWYEHEEQEGEVHGQETIELAADPLADSTVEEATGEKCNKCNKAVGECTCEEKELVAGNEETADGEMKSAEGEEAPVVESPAADEAPVAEAKTEELVADDSDISKTLLAGVDINGIVEKAVKSAMESVTEEVTLLKSAKEAVENKAAELEAELATAKSLAIGGGPKRAAIATGIATKSTARQSEVSRLLAKAAATTDRDYAEGLKQLAEEIANADDAKA